MSLPDAGYSAGLDAEVIKPVWFAWLDVLGDEVRANTSGANITPSGTGDTDLDGFEFIGISARLVEVSPVKVQEGGSETVTARLSGIEGLDDADLALLADPANWRGRDARLWNIIRDQTGTQQGGYYCYYTGKMVGLTHSGSPNDGQVLTVTIESYLAVFSEASNRTYLDQERYDPDDLSARAAIAIANGNYTGAATNSGSSSGRGGNNGNIRGGGAGGGARDLQEF